MGIKDWFNKKDKNLEGMCKLAYMKKYEGKGKQPSNYKVYGCKISDKPCVYYKSYDRCDKYRAYYIVHGKKDGKK